MTRETWGLAFGVVALVMLAAGLHAGLAQRDHAAGAVAVTVGLAALLVAASLVRRR